jgi:F-type H+-transporting ATPase subunit b
VDLLALASLTSHLPLSAPPGAAEQGGLVINVFWILVVSANFLIFLVAAWYLGLRNLPANLGARRARIEQSLRDADAARVEREQAAQERLAVLAQARTDAEDILTRAQRVADESRDRDLAETRTQIEQMRERAAADIVTEKERAIAEVRGQVAELALLAAGRVVGETMNEPRERRLVEEFLTQTSAAASGTSNSPGASQSGRSN